MGKYNLILFLIIFSIGCAGGTIVRNIETHPWVKRPELNPIVVNPIGEDATIDDVLICLTQREDEIQEMWIIDNETNNQLMVNTIEKYNRF